MIISHQYSFIFIHIPKNGGSSIEIAFSAQHSKWDDLVLGGSSLGQVLEQPFQKKFNIGKHSTLTNIAQLYNWDKLRSYYIFTLVRNPYDRIVSLWNYLSQKVDSLCDKLECSKDDLFEFSLDEEKVSMYPVLAWKGIQACLESSNLDQFLRHEKFPMAPSAKPQMKWIQHPDKSFKIHIFKLEELPTCCKALKSNLGLDLSIPRANISRKKMRSTDMTRESRDFIKKLYSEDFRVLGYNT